MPIMSGLGNIFSLQKRNKDTHVVMRLHSAQSIETILDS